MIKKNFLLIAVICCFVLSFGCNESDSQPSKTVKSGKAGKSGNSNEVQINFSEDEKQYLIGVARKAFELWVTKKDKYEPNDVPSSLKGRKVNRVFATIYKKGEWRGCVSAMGKDAVDATVKSVINTCKDRRFEDPKADELDDFRVEVSYLQPFELISTKDPEKIKKELEPGVHGISIRHSSGKRAFFLPYVFVKKQRTTITWLERICKKAGLKKDDWKSPDTSIYRYNTINFIEESPKGKAVDLYRYKVELDALKSTAVKDAIKLSVDWFNNHLDKNSGNYLTGYDMRHRPIKKSDVALQLFALTAVSDAIRLDYADKKAVDIEKAISNAMQNLMIEIPGKDQLESLIVLGEVILNSDSFKDREKTIDSLLEYLEGHSKTLPKRGKHIRDLGSYATFVISGLADVTKKKQHIKFAKEIYGEYWLPEARFSLLALLNVAKLEGFDNIGTKITQETDRIISKLYDNKNAPYRDFVGSFKNEKVPSTFGVSIYLRSMAKVYDVLMEDQAALKKKVFDTALLTVRWVLEQQFTEASAFYFPGYKKQLGAFKQDILLNTTMLDDTATALIGLMTADKAFGKEMSEAFEKNKEIFIKNE